MSRAVFALCLAFTLTVVLGCGPGPADESGSAAAASEAAAARPAAEPLLIDADELWRVAFSHDSGAQGELVFPEMMGGGVAVFDADGDHDLDLYFVSGAPGLGADPAPSGPTNRLFAQGEDGYADVTAKSGLGDAGYGTGVAVGDIDNDGDEDVFVANIGPDTLYKGRGDGVFDDATTAAGLVSSGSRAEQWSTSAAFCDIDRDGYLDLYVVRYVIFDASITCTDQAGRREYCGPDSFEDRTDQLWHNRGDGTFEDITSTAGLDVVTGAGLGVVCDDMNDDGWVDFYVANDGDPNQLWINQHDGTFIDDALIMGASVNAAGLHEAGMGVVAADFDNDADFDLFVTHLRDETNTYYRNLGNGVGFEDQTVRAGLATASTPFTGFGTAAVDLDLDGDLDLAISNGRVKRGAPTTSTLPPPWNLYGEPNLVYLNDGGTFRLAGDEVGAFAEPIEVGRGLATGDLDDDGDIDFVLNNIGGPARLYRAEPRDGHWLLVDAFDPRLNRRALGARIVLTSAAGRQLRTVQGTMSYLSSSDPRAHFGLGSESGPVSLEVRWPDGLVETFADVASDRSIVLRRGEGSR